MPMFKATDLYPCNDDNRLYYEIAVNVSRNENLGSRKALAKRMKYLKEYAAERLPVVYETSPCKRLAKTSPDSVEYYQALIDILDWHEPWQLEDYWTWLEKHFSWSSFVMTPLNSLVAWGLNVVLDMDCTVEEWNKAFKILNLIDLYRLAGKNVVIEMGDRTYTLHGF